MQSFCFNKSLLLPDIHGRKFWKEACTDISGYDRVIFLGDYLDPYDFEYISVDEAIENFKEIISFKKKNMEKVVLLLGNHDMPYAFRDYYEFSSWHCLHSSMHHDEISKFFEDNMKLFGICHVEGNVIFTHAGIDGGWLKESVKYDGDDMNDISVALNKLTSDKYGLLKLFKITRNRGGNDRYGSCIWTDLHNMLSGRSMKGIESLKQVFGHTLQVFYSGSGEIVYGNAIEQGNLKMIDTANAYELDTEKFEIKSLRYKGAV